MPTARPNITARTGVTLLRFTQWVASRIDMLPSPTPKMAVISGSPAATTDPKVKISTIKAMPTPMASLVVLIFRGSPNAAPPVSTVSPFSRPTSIAERIAARCSSVTSAGEGTSRLNVV